MSKNERIAHLRVFDQEGLNPHYAGWFACFNRAEYFEAHEVLEALWLSERGRSDADFYKGLIQLAGAFVHLQKNRLRPADALFRLAETNLHRYAPRHLHLHVEPVLGMIGQWREQLRAGDFTVNPLSVRAVPRITPDAPNLHSPSDEAQNLVPGE